MSNYVNGFIGSIGEFYPVVDDIRSSHIDLANEIISSKKYQKFMDDHKNLISGFDSKDLIIHIFGFVYYTHYNNEPVVILPDKVFNGKRINKNQIDSLENIMKTNNEEPYRYDYFMQIFDKDIRYNYESELLGVNNRRVVK